MSTTAKRPRLSVATYDRMVEAGILPETNRFELINGKLVEKVTKGEKHSASSERTWRAIHALLPAGWHVRIEKPVSIPRRRSEPEPDVSVARGGVDDYEDRHPGPADVALVVEVTRTSAAKDRGLARTYGGGGVPVYWIVNIPQRRIEVYSDPSGRGRSAVYRQGTTFGDGEVISVVLDGLEIGRVAVSDILPKP